MAHQKRRTWDKDVYRELAQNREDGVRERPEPMPTERRQALEQRDYKLDFDGIVGKAAVISANTSHSRRGGFYCDVCDCVMKDSQTYTDHLNGRKHQRMLGMSMKVKKVTVADVRARILSAGKANDAKKNYDFDKTIEERKRKDEEERMRRKEESKRRKREGNHSEERKSGHEERSYDSESDSVSRDRKRARRDYNNEEPRERKPSLPPPPPESELEPEVDPELLRMAETMGVPLSFGGSKKQ